MKLRIDLKKDVLRCETCGAEVTEENVYVREIDGVKHYFCCSHCADAYTGGGSHCSC